MKVYAITREVDVWDEQDRHIETTVMAVCSSQSKAEEMKKKSEEDLQNLGIEFVNKYPNCPYLANLPVIGEQNEKQWAEYKASYLWSDSVLFYIKEYELE